MNHAALYPWIPQVGEDRRKGVARLRPIPLRLSEKSPSHSNIQRKAELWGSSRSTSAKRRKRVVSLAVIVLK